MANLKRNTTGYTAFGLLLDELCQQKQMSFRALATASHLQPGYHTVIARICRGEVTPKREHILLWADILEASPEQRRDFLRAFHYAEDEQASEVEEAHAHIAELERQLASLALELQQTHTYRGTIMEQIKRLQPKLIAMRDYHQGYLDRRARTGITTATDSIMSQHQETLAETLNLLEAIKKAGGEQG